ncbi:ComF family protein [soil metagenome]
MLGTAQDSLLSLVFPQKCQVCSGQVERQADGVACIECWSSTRLFDRSEMLCEKCGAFIGDKAGGHPVYCHQCDDHSYDKAAALGVYEKGLAAAVIDLKKRPFLAVRIKEAIHEFVRLSEMFHDSVIVPVPLSIQRRKERGFNQAEVIAKALSRSSSFSLDSASLVRKSHTPIHRAGMDKKARELSVKKAFEVVRPRLISEKPIILVDDVFTSGSTASACAKALKKNGASSVNVFTLARAVLR